ncbi:hypothetical protein SAMN05216302_10154 [Nitrosomonas aestuarii]|uniref:DNA polymerase family A n=1 Tax=Nitrosomonas aestuarii TaxID=52441 RepID=A0A1I4CB11_9PROT|nr:hypothetical protein [Nitrosomonas aestuarii]SFK77507.1 hypothetical protein SAMN05216302_10154 [Nitrosomonas aestuarii]
MNNIDLEYRIAKAIELDNSELFDVHTWSEYPEVNQCLNFIYHEFINNSFKGNEKIRKKHIKVIILDLYVKWLKDPTMYSSFYRAHWYYDDLESRYNKLHISKLTCKIVDALEKLEYIHPIAKGHNGRRSGKKSHMSRMRTTDKLIDLIVNKHRIKPEMIERFPTTECIILRDYNESKKRQINIPYNDTDNPQIEQWRIDLCAHNNLLRKTFIDIPMCPPDGIPTKSQDGKTIKISRHEKFVSRIFNNGNWENGGRFYGGWWQRIPSEWRTRIRIFNTPVTEIDYSGLHIVLLYAMVGITYTDDPYRIEELEHSERMRELLKPILLASINAEDKDSARKAIQREINFNPDEFGWVKNEGLNISDIIDTFTNQHSPIKDYFFSGSGIRLQNIDSIIAEKVINYFTQKSVVVLCIHDSFVIGADKADELKLVMENAFNEALGELDLNLNQPPKISLEGLGIDQWHTILSHPEWVELRDLYLFKDKHNYPEWNERMESFKQRKFEDYYVPEADLKN